MRHQNDKKSDFQLPFHIPPRIILFLLTICCICSMGFYYFKKENIVSFTRAADLVFTPFQKGINALGNLFFQLQKDRLDMEEALAKIESLEAENAGLNQQIRENRMITYDYQQLKALLDLKNSYPDYDTIGASVVFSNSGGNWFSSFTIDKGSEDGLETGMNVLADGGLAGYLSEVGPHYSVVSTIINDNTNVSGEQLSTQDACIVVGDLPLMQEKGLLRLEYMSNQFDMSKDTLVVTSRISDRYLPGILIGYIQDVTVNPNKLSSSGYLKPAVDFEHLSHVLVISTKKTTWD